MTEKQKRTKAKLRQAQRKVRGAELSWGWIKPGGRKDQLRTGK